MKNFLIIFLLIFFNGLILGCKGGERKIEVTETVPKPGFVLGQEIDTVKLKEEFLPKGYSYDPAGRRDPFASLIGKGYKREEEEVVDLSNLKLVGIMRGQKGNVALFEAPDGRSYIIRQGDAVRNGYVKSIGDKEVIVEITAYGVPITVKYELKREKIE
ncbi:MAG: pilus assembly protein PilP [Candidatus Hydrothermales bacterium]